MVIFTQPIIHRERIYREATLNHPLSPIKRGNETVKKNKTKRQKITPNNVTVNMVYLTFVTSITAEVVHIFVKGPSEDRLRVRDFLAMLKTNRWPFNCYILFGQVVVSLTLPVSIHKS